MTLHGIDVFSGRAVRVRIEGGLVADVRPTRSAADLPYLAPGFFDIQVNGFRGRDYSAEDLAPEHVHQVTADLAAAGVTRHLPTIITGPREQVRRNLSVIAAAVESSQELRQAIPGIHLEGPYICAEDGPRGAHDAAFVRDAQWEELSAWQEAARGMIRLVTLAPERPGALELIRRAAEAGLRLAIGHTGAAPAVIAEAVQAGASLSTHLGNGSHGLIPRLKNYIWEQLACDELQASIITDGFHLPDSVIRTFWRTKGKDRIILTSDVAVMGGLGPGVYSWGGVRVEVFPDGHLGLAGTEYLAGAAHLLDWDIPRCLAAAGCSLAEAIGACTVNPCRYLGLARTSAEGSAGTKEGPAGGCGRLEPGAPAHIVQFRWQAGDRRLGVEQTIRGGQVVYSAPG